MSSSAVMSGYAAFLDSADSSSATMVPDPTLRSSSYLVLAHFAGEGVSVDAERVSRAGQAAVAAAQYARNEPLLELVNGIDEVDAAFDHLVDEPVEPIAD